MFRIIFIAIVCALLTSLALTDICSAQGFGGRRGKSVGGRQPSVPSYRQPVRNPNNRQPVRQGGSQSVTGPRGGSITAGGVRGSNGNSMGGRVGGVKVVTPSGKTITRGGGGVVGRGSDGAVRGGQFQGGSVAGNRGVVRGGAARSVVTDGSFSRYRSGVGIGASRTIGRTHRTVAITRSTLRNRGGLVRANVRHSFPGHIGWFGNHWYRRYPRAWRPPVSIQPVWVGAPYARWATWLAWSTVNQPAPAPIYYDYGTTIVYQSDIVYRGQEQIATAEEYFEQASQIANRGERKTAANSTWHSFGVFAMVQGGEDTASKILQLSADENGTVRGNFYDVLTETATPLSGSIDKGSQRAAWVIGDNSYNVYEAGVADLTSDELTILVHFGKDKTQQWQLVRLEGPEADSD